jgi:hypothetical protein
MVTFKEYLLEYKTKENSIISGIVGLKSGLNGKSFDRAHLRKNANTIRKEYTPKHEVPAGILKGQPLLTVLNNYGIVFSPGEKRLGNSKTRSIKMYVDANGEQCGLVRKINQNEL